MKMKVNEIIKKRRKELGLTLKEVAEQLGVSESLISRYESNNVKNMGIDKIEPLSRILKCTPEYLMGWENKQESNVRIVDMKDFITVPVYGKASAGKGYLNLETAISHKTIHINGYSHDCYLVEVEGDSMEPTIHDGEFVLVDPTDIDIVTGKVYVVTFDSETFIKKIECHGNIAILKSINSNYSDKVIDSERFEDLKIEGKVIKVISERKL